MSTPTGPRATGALLRRRADLPDGHPDRARLRREAILASLPMARHLAQRYAGRGEPLDDLIQVASLALVQAVDGYDPRRPESFAGYAVPTIQGMLRKHFRDHAWAMRVPRQLQERAMAVRDATEELTGRLGRTPRRSELAGYLHAERWPRRCARPGYSGYPPWTEPSRARPIRASIASTTGWRYGSCSAGCRRASGGRWHCATATA